MLEEIPGSKILKSSSLPYFGLFLSQYFLPRLIISLIFYETLRIIIPLECVSTWILKEESTNYDLQTNLGPLPLFVCKVLLPLSHNCVYVHAKSLSSVWLLAILWTEAFQAPLSMEFSRQEYWSGLPCSSPEDLPHPGTEPALPTTHALQTDSLPLRHQGSPQSQSFVEK